MKKYIVEFFKKKNNIFLIAFQTLAILSLCFLQVWNGAFVLAFLFEGAFFITFGIRYLQKNKEIDQNQEIREKITIEEMNVEKIRKKNKMTKKSNVMQALLFFALGLILIVMVII